MRFLVWIAIAIIFVYLFKSLLSAFSRTHEKSDDDIPSRLAESEKMVQCRCCGTHIPASEAVLDSSGAVFCCKEHQMQHFSGK